MQSDDKVKFCYTTVCEIEKAEQNAIYYKAMKNVESELCTLNLNRGGKQTYGFVFEDLHTSTQNIENMKIHNNEVVYVLDNNGIADFKVIDANGNVSYQQAKAGYHGSNKYKITKEKYGDQVLVVDKGNNELIERAEKIGIQSKESTISKEQAERLTGIMESEGKVRGQVGLSNTAPITSKLYALSQEIKAANVAGLDSAKGAAALAGGMSFGKNFYMYMEGNIDLQELVLDTTKDTVVAGVGGYAAGAVGYVVSGVVSETIIGTAVTNVVVSMGMESMLVSVGSVMATVSAATGPLFLAGMAIGTGIAVCQSLKAKSEAYRRKMSQANRAINQALQAMEAAYNSMNQDLKDFCEFWDNSFERGFEKLLNATMCDDFEGFAEGLDIISTVFDSHVLFRTEREFDDFFFDDEAVLTI
jgi:hypothetical protein